MPTPEYLEDFKSELQGLTEMRDHLIKVGSPLARMLIGACKLASNTYFSVSSANIPQLYESAKTSYEIIEDGKAVYEAVKSIAKRIRLLSTPESTPLLADWIVERNIERYSLITEEEIAEAQNEIAAAQNTPEFLEELETILKSYVISTDEEKTESAAHFRSELIDSVELLLEETDEVELLNNTHLPQESTFMMLKRMAYDSASYTKDTASSIASTTVKKGPNVLGIIADVAKILLFSEKIYERVESVGSEHGKKNEGTENSLTNTRPNSVLRQDSVEYKSFETSRSSLS